MAKQVWIHIGPPKTGTSAIQKWLLGHREWLSGHGIMYPTYELGPNGISSGHVHTVLSEESGKFYLDKNKVEALLSEFERSDKQILLLSSEHFFYHVEALAEAFTKVRFIAYVRCPIETFESVYNQSVKRHGKAEALVFSHNLHTTTLDRLSRLATELPRQKFYFRAYLQSNESFNLVADFLAVLKLDYPVENEKTNPSYTFEALETKRWLNRFTLNELDAEIDQALQAVAVGTTDYSLLPDDKKARHLKQCIQNLRLFHTQHHIKNARMLLNAVSKREHLAVVSQDNLPGAIELISRQLSMTNPDLYQRICQALSQQDCGKDDQALVDLFSRFQKKKTLGSKIRQIAKRFVG